MYILIVLSWMQIGGAYVGGNHITYQEFTNEQNCLHAADTIQLDRPNIKAICVPK